MLTKGCIEIEVGKIRPQKLCSAFAVFLFRPLADGLRNERGEDKRKGEPDINFLWMK